MVSACPHVGPLLSGFSVEPWPTMTSALSGLENMEADRYAQSRKLSNGFPLHVAPDVSAAGIAPALATASKDPNQLIYLP